MNLFSRIRALFQKRRLEAEMAEEMRLHQEQRVRENLTAGMAPHEARDAAQRAFGHADGLKETAREQRGFVWLEQFGQDLRYAARQLRRNPGFAATAILILALGIGATTAIFSVVNGLLLKPLRYDEPDRLMLLYETRPDGAQNLVSPGVLTDWREQARTFEEVGYFRSTSLNFSGRGTPERVDVMRMSANTLALLRARPVLGRIFAPDEDQPGQDKVAVLSYRMWQRRFGGERDAIGRSILLADEPYTIIGVLPPDFLSVETLEVVIPYVFEAGWREMRDAHFMRAMGRLKPGVTLAQARAELEAITERSRSSYPEWKKKWGAGLMPLQRGYAEDVRPASFLLLGAVGLVLLIVCANVANLLLAKASVRRREIAVRAALGASRARLVRQLLTESALLSFLGAALGLGLAFWLIGMLRHTLTAMAVDRAYELGLDAGALGAALIASVGTGLLCGLAPAWEASRFAPGRNLNQAPRDGASDGRRLRGALIVAEVALALMLLIGAGLMLDSFKRLMQVPAGFDPERALTMQVTLSGQKYPGNARRAAFYNQIAERVAALPGVEAAGLNRRLPMTGYSNAYFRIPGRENQPEAGYLFDYDFCTADYFRAMGIPLLRGRAFTVAEVAAGARVAVINASVAREFFPGEDPLGRKIGPTEDPWEIVGVVGDVRNRSLDGAITRMLYRPHNPSDSWSSAALIVRTRGAPEALAGSVINAIHELDPAQPVSQVMPLTEVVRASLGERRLILGLLGSFAGTALLLAAIGLYGVVAYAVTQRTREFGIRLALGAHPRDVMHLVLGNGLRLTLAGLMLGVAGAYGLSRLMGRFLYETKPADPAVYASVSVLLLLTALLASWLPARRATKVDPMTALRAE